MQHDYQQQVYRRYDNYGYQEYEGYREQPPAVPPQQGQDQSPIPPVQSGPVEHPAYNHLMDTPHQQQGVLFAASFSYTNERLTAALTYLFGWFSGLLFAIFTTSRYVRYHALQSLLFFGGITLIDLSFIYFMAHLHIGRFLPFFPEFMIVMGFLLLNVIAFVGWIVGMVQAYRGTYYRMPVVGTIVANIMGTQAPLK